MVSPRKSRRKSPCFSRTTTSMPARARRKPSTAPAGPHPAIAQVVAAGALTYGVCASSDKLLAASCQQLGGTDGHESCLTLAFDEEQHGPLAGDPHRGAKLVDRAHGLAIHFDDDVAFLKARIRRAAVRASSRLICVGCGALRNASSTQTFTPRTFSTTSIGTSLQSLM